MLDVYVVTAPSVVEVFLDYPTADAFRNRVIVAGYHDVNLLHRKVDARGDTVAQTDRWSPTNPDRNNGGTLGEGTDDVYRLGASMRPDEVSELAALVKDGHKV